MLPVAPPFEGRHWPNCEPFALAELGGRVVIVVFWSLGCEASLLVVDRLESIARDHDDRGEPVTVVAVHTPRFPYEADPGRVRAAIDRHRIGAEVIDDPDGITWNRYNPDGWPSAAVISRAGRVVGMAGGLAAIDTVAEAVTAELRRPFQARGAATVARSPRLRPPVDDRTVSTLRHPAGVAVAPSGRLAVADAGNDRLLVGPVDPDLRTLRPDVEITDLDQPSAVAFGSDEVLYVVERGSGSVLQIDLESGTVDAVADEELAIPTALLVDRDGSLVVADAGLDQLVRITGCGGTDVVIGPIAGSGVTGWRDGPAGRAELAQPVALARTAAGIAFCDAATSNLRLLTDDGAVVTVTDHGFYDFGLVDGPLARARLQRPGGLASGPDGSLVVADTGNDRIRVVQDRRLRTMGLAGLDQPTGLASLPSGHVLIADTGNHRLVAADPAGRTAWPIAVYPPVMTSVWEPAAADG